MKKNPLLLFLFGLIFIAGGCITHVSVVKVTKDNRDTVNGLRVNLPVPFIVGTPAPDGSIKYAIQYFPDPDEEYAISTWSFLAKQKADISRSSEMFLTKANLTQDSTAVATQLVNSAGVIGKGVIDTLASEKQDEITADKAAAKAKNDAIVTKTTDVTGKTLLVEKAQATVDSAQQTLQALMNASPPDAAAIKTAQTVLTAANLTLAQAKIDLKYAQAALATATASNADQATALPQAKGIVVYRIQEDAGQGIKLVPVNFSLFGLDGKKVADDLPQLNFETAGSKAKDSSAPSTSSSDKLDPPVEEIKVDKSVPSQFKQDLTFTDEIKDTAAAPSIKNSKGNELPNQIKVTSSKKTITLEIDNGLAEGTYTLQLKATFVDNQSHTFPISIKVNPPK